MPLYIQGAKCPKANGNRTTSGDVTLAYNLLNLPEYMSVGGEDIYQDYVSSGQKYRKEGPSGNGGTEIRFYVAGVEFVDSLPQTYNFGDGRVYWETPTNPNEAPKHHLQYRLTDPLVV